MRKRFTFLFILSLTLALTLSLAGMTGCKSNDQNADQEKAKAEAVEETSETNTATAQIDETDVDNGQRLGDYAATLCWPYGQMDKGRYDGGTMAENYAVLYDSIRPQDESDIDSTQWRAGASCDLFVATALKGFGIDDFPVTLSRQCEYFFLSDAYKEHFDQIETGGSASAMEHGDVVIYIRAGSENNGQGHIFIVNKSEGKNWRSNAHYRKDNGYYGVTDDFDDYDPGHYKYFGVFRLRAE